MTEDGAARLGLQNLAEAAVLPENFPGDARQLVAWAGVYQKDPAEIQVLSVSEPLPDVVAYHLGDVAPVFFGHGHFAVDYLHTGVELQEVRAQGGDGGTAAALFHVVQPVQDKAGFQPGDHAVQQA